MPPEERRTYAPDLPALAVHRALAGVFGIDRHLLSFQRQYEERGDLPGIQLFLRVLRITLEAMKRELIRTSRADLQGEYVPDPNYVEGSPYGSEEDADDTIVVVPLDSRLSIQFVDEFEEQFRRWIDLLAAPQGRGFDSLAEPFRRLAKSIPTEEDFELVFRPVPERTYGIWFDVVDSVARIAQVLDRNVADTLDAMPRLWAIEYPLFEEDDTFQHSCIAHELGHIAYDALPPGQLARNGERIFIEATEEVGEVDADPTLALNWFTELACDLLAIRMLGPAFAVALTEWTLTQNVWFHEEDSAGFYTHPPMPWRLDLLRDEVSRYMEGSEHSDDPVWRAAGAALERWTSVIPEVSVPDVPELPLIQSALRRLRDQADEILGPASYQPAVFAVDLPAVCSKLTDDMAPAEAVYDRDRERPADSSAWSEPIDWRSILNGGYIYYLERLHREHPGPERPPILLRPSRDRDNRRLADCTHIQGSIELSELHRQMTELKDQLSALELPDLA